MVAGAALAAGACGAGGQVPKRSALADVFGLPPSTGFPLGVSCGDVDVSSARMVTRYSGARALELRVVDTQSGGALAVSAPATNAPMVSVDIHGLAPGRQYVYAFVELDDTGAALSTSTLGTFRSPPAVDDRQPLVITASACSQKRYGFETLARAAEIDSDVHLLLGDTSYNDGARTLEEFRTEWLETLSRQQYVALRASCSVIATWDDHEVMNNWDKATVPADVVAAAQQAFLEHVPARRPTTEKFQLWRSVRWGGTAELFLLDLYTDQSHDEGRFISDEQMDWLINGVKESSAAFKILVTSLPLSHMSLPFEVYRRSRWDAFPRQRRQLLRALDGVPGLFAVSGDVHMPVLGRVEHSGDGSKIHEVIVGPAAHTVNPLWPTMRGPQFLWSGGFGNIAVMELDPQSMQVTVNYVDEVGDSRVTLSFKA